MALIALIGKLGLTPTVTYELRSSRKRVTHRLLSEPPTGFHVTVLNQAERVRDRRFRITCTTVAGEQWRIICDTFCEGQIVLEEASRGLIVSAASITDLDRECVRRICGDSVNALKLLWDADSIREELDDQLAGEDWVGPPDPEVLQRATDAAAAFVHEYVGGYFSIDLDVVRMHVRGLVPGLTELIRDPELTRSEATADDYRAALSANPEARRGPVALRQQVEDIRTRLSQPVSPESTHGTLRSLLDLWNAQRALFLSHYDLYAAGCSAVWSAISALMPVSERLRALLRNELTAAHVLTTVTECLSYLSQTTVVHRLDPSNDQVHWSSFQREMPAHIADQLGTELPTSDELWTLWSRRSHVAMHLCGFVQLALQQTSWTRSMAYRVAETLAESGPPLRVAKGSTASIARILSDKGCFAAASLILRSAYGEVPAEFEAVTIWAQVSASLGKSDHLPNDVLERLFERARRLLLFEIGAAWERLCHEILLEKWPDVVADRDGATRLTTGLRPDFACNGVERSATSLVRAGMLVDAKKSRLAIADDVEAYLPHCDQLGFLILDDEPRFAIEDGPSVQLIYVSDILPDVHSPDLRTRIRALQERSKSYAVEIAERVAEDSRAILTDIRSGSA